MPTVTRQLFKYAIAGGGAAALYAVTYILFANYLLPRGYAVAAVVPAFFLSLTASFLLHSRWSFAGHGTREKGMGQKLRFMLVQMGGLGLNAGFTWLVTSVLGGANWMALMPCLILTPLATFAVQRMWVFS